MQSFLIGQETTLTPQKYGDNTNNIDNSSNNNATTDWLGNNIVKREKIVATYYQKKNFPDDKNKIIQFASKISNNNLDFIATLDKESAGSWDVNVKSKPNRNGTYDKGICQFNSAYYKHYYNDPNWSNHEWQITKCWHLYDSAVKRGKIKTTFYGYNKRQASKKNFELVTFN